MSTKTNWPAMPLLIGDWQKEAGVKAMTPADEGIFLRLIFVCWESERRGYLQLNNKPYPLDLLADTIKVPLSDLTAWMSKYQDIFQIFGVSENGILYSRKHVKLVELSNKRKNAGKQGGNPVLLNQEVNQKKIRGKPNAVIVTVNETVNVNGTKIPEHLLKIWPDFLEFRKKKKAPMTDKAVTLILKTLSPHPPDIQVRMLEQTIEHGWSGVFELKTDFKDIATNKTTPSGGVKPKEGKYKDL